MPFNRVHPLYVVIAGLRFFRDHYEYALAFFAIVLALYRNFSKSGSPLTMVFVLFGALVAFIVVVLLLGYLEWRAHVFWVRDGVLHVERGIFVRERKHVPLSRIQGVEFEADLLERLFRLVRVRFIVAGGDASSEGIVIRALRREEALSWAQAVAPKSVASLGWLKGRAGAPAKTSKSGETTTAAPEAQKAAEEAPAVKAAVDPTSPEASGEVLAERTLSWREALWVAFTNTHGVGYFIIFLSLYYTKGEKWIGGRERLIEFLVAHHVIATAPPPQILVLLELLALAALSWIFAWISAFVDARRFRLLRTKESLVVERGVFSKTTRILPVERIQTVSVDENWLRAFLGWAEVRVSVAGEPGQYLIRPLLRRGEVDAFVKDFLPEHRVRFETLHVLPPVARRRYFLRALRRGLLWAVLIWLGLGAGAHAVGLEGLRVLRPYVVFLAVLFSLLLGERQYRGGGYFKSEDGFLLRTQFIRRRTLYLPRRRLQEVRVRATPFQRRYRLATLEVAWPGGTMKVVDVPLEEALTTR